MHSIFIDTLRDPAVRDLAWVIGSPSLLEHSYPAYNGNVVADTWCSAQFDFRKPWLAKLDLAPLELHEYIAARPTRRLGHYFESLIAYWLTHIPDTQIIATNLQVQDEQRTLGEYDFLFRNDSNVICHWEAAVKFYLHLEPLPEQRSFIGPGARDRLDLKLNRVFQHQLTLGHTPAGQAALPAGIKLGMTQAFIKGYLFYHASDISNISANGVSANHLRGWWVRHRLEKIPQTNTETRWIILPRMSWLAPARVAADAEVLSFEILCTYLDEHFKLHSEAILVFELARSSTGAWHEISRGFVVSSSWPA